MTRNANIPQIDFNSPVPYYAQLMEVLKATIETEALAPGDQLPSEPDLCDTYGISRTVVRHALRELEADGLIVRRKGKGTFVADSKINESLVQKLTGFYHDMIERGKTPVTQVLNEDIVPASPVIAARLNIREGEPVYTVERLRFVDGEPLLLVRAYLPHAFCPGIETVDLSKASLYDTLETRFNLRIVNGRRSIEAVAADERQADLLGIKPGDPVLLLESLAYLADGTTIEFFQAVHRGDRTRFEVELLRIPEKVDLDEIVKEVDHDLPHSN